MGLHATLTSSGSLLTTKSFASATQVGLQRS